MKVRDEPTDIIVDPLNKAYPETTLEDSSVLEKLALLREEVKSLQKANAMTLQQFSEFRRDLKRIIQILERREAIRTHYGAEY